jgi:hypothetical protein
MAAAAAVVVQGVSSEMAAGADPEQKLPGVHIYKHMSICEAILVLINKTI